MEVVEQKREIRKLVGEWGSQFPDNLKREQEAKLYALLERVPQFFEAKKIAFYWSLKSEFFTHDFINKWADISVPAEEDLTKPLNELPYGKMIDTNEENKKNMLYVSAVFLLPLLTLKGLDVLFFRRRKKKADSLQNEEN